MAGHWQDSLYPLFIVQKVKEAVQQGCFRAHLDPRTCLWDCCCISEHGHQHLACLAMASSLHPVLPPFYAYGAVNSFMLAVSLLSQRHWASVPAASSMFIVQQRWSWGLVQYFSLSAAAQPLLLLEAHGFECMWLPSTTFTQAISLLIAWNCSSPLKQASYTQLTVILIYHTLEAFDRHSRLKAFLAGWPSVLNHEHWALSKWVCLMWRS